MKKYVSWIASIVLLASCEKMDLFEREKLCPVVAPENVPAEVKTSFEARYPGTVVKTWYDKDGTGYCAEADVNGDDVLALFDRSGIFQKDLEEEDDERRGRRNRNTGCECEKDD